MKLGYDVERGGTVQLGTQVSAFGFAAAAVDEIQKLLTHVREPDNTKLIFQSLPTHMRRRAMSHHPKRLPRKYRAAHKSQMAKAGTAKKGKRVVVCRKRRRLARNLLSPHTNQLRKNRWMETHIWHARRFHMINRWGYRLPYASCDKTYRACYRASAYHCLLQDVSYMQCMEMRGSMDDLRAGFEQMCRKECGLSINAVTYVSGKREGNVMMYKAQRYPNDAIGNVAFMWRPPILAENERRIWLWVHPSFYNVLKEELIKVFHLVSSGKTKSIPLDNGKDNKFVLKTKGYHPVKTHKSANSSVELRELGNAMCRFRLTGPLSQSVLHQAFQPAEDDHFQRFVSQYPPASMSADVIKASHHDQNRYWQLSSNDVVQSPAELPSNVIIGLNICDPRTRRPEKRTKAKPTTRQVVNDAQIAMNLYAMPDTLAQSVLWDEVCRDHVASKMLSTKAYCDLRERHAVIPTAKCRFEEDLQPVPVVLVQRPGSGGWQKDQQRLGYGCGWDVIVPANYGMTVWLTLIMWGARPGGLRESDSVASELGVDPLMPDSIIGQQNAAMRHAELKAKFMRMPPNKRCNYRRIAIVSPFRAPFKELIRDWLPTNCETVQSFHVIRDRVVLDQLSRRLKHPSEQPLELLAPNGLVPVHLQMASRGSVGQFAMICLPTAADFKRRLRFIKYGHHGPAHTEPLAIDPTKRDRKTLTDQHKKLLKRLRSRRLKAIRKNPEKRAELRRSASTAPLVQAQLASMAALWLPEDLTTANSIRGQCSREVAGYVTNSQFALTKGFVCLLGYVAPEALATMIAINGRARVPQTMCLVRDTKSRHYHFAKISVNLAGET